MGRRLAVIRPKATSILPRPGATWLHSRSWPAPRCPRWSATCPSSHIPSGLARVVLRVLDAQRKVPTTKDGCPRATGSRAGRGGAHRRAWERACAHPRAWQGAPRQLKGLCHRLPAPDSAFERGRKCKNRICFLGGINFLITSAGQTTAWGRLVGRHRPQKRS